MKILNFFKSFFNGYLMLNDDFYAKHGEIIMRYGNVI